LSTSRFLTDGSDNASGNKVTHSDTLFVIIINAANGTVGIDTMSLVQLGLFFGGAMDTLLKDGFSLDGLKFGLEVFQTCSVAAAIGTTTGVVDIEASILNFFTIDTP